jgi:hypothetical protein
MMIGLQSIYDLSVHADENGPHEGRREAMFRPRLFFPRTAIQFHADCRLSLTVLERLVRWLGHLMFEPVRNYELEPFHQIIAAMRELASGSRYLDTGHSHGLSGPTIGRYLRKFVKAVISELFNEFVRWPASAADCQDIADRFALLPETVNGFDDVCGCLDGTLVPFTEAPIPFDQQYYTARIHRSAINVMVVCGPEKQFYYCSASYPGSVHDLTVLRESRMFRRFERGWRPFEGKI